MLNKLLLAAGFVLAIFLPAHAAEQGGSITISVAEYERLKELEEGDKKKQFWKMTYEQILQKENNSYSRAWEIYEFWVLRTIYLSGAVSGSAVSDVVNKIATLNQIGNKPITLVVRSPGGGVLEGMSLINAMERSIAPVNTICDSYAFSMGAVVFAVGKHRVAEDGCAFMLHDVSVGAPGGQTMEHIKWTETVINIETQLVNILARVSGLSSQEVRTLMEYETFWSGEEVFRLGFADEYFVNDRGLADRDIPDDLLPLNRMKKNFNEKLSK